MTLPFSDEYHEGEMVQCQRCAKNVRVKYYDRDSVVVVSTQEQQTLALRCQYCGYVLCDSCAHPANSLFPICPSCQREWGPYYFTHEVISPSSSKAVITEDTPPPPQPQLQAQAPVLEAPPAQVESLGAGEADLYGEYKNWERKKVLKRIVAIVLALLVVGLIIGLVMGPGKPLLKKGLAQLKTRPTRVQTAVVVLKGTQTPGSETQVKSTQFTPIISLTPIKPSSTSATTTSVGPTSKVIDTLTPTLTKVATTSPTATATLEPTFTTTAATSSECVPALSITLDDVGKKLCVTGMVVFTLQTSTSFSIFFSNEDGYFRIVVYDRVPKDIKKGVCVRVTGEIKTLTGIPVMALGYNDVIEICSP